MKIPFNICNQTRKKFLQLKNKIIKNETIKNKKIKNKTIKKKIKYTVSETKKHLTDLLNNFDKKNKVIPLNIFQVWHDKKKIPVSVKESIELIKKQNPEFKHHLFDEKECYNFIKKYFSKKILNAYEKVIPHALKADLWRYCVLYKHGGIYLDSKYYGVNNFKLILLTDKEYFCRDINISFNGIYNAILICKPKNKILLKCINKCVKNIENELYYSQGLCPTGPLMMKQFFNKTQLNNLNLVLEVVDKNNKYINLNNYRILKFHENYSKDKAQTSNHWSVYWKNKTMYKT